MPAPKSTRPAAARLGVEVLEDRTVPSVLDGFAVMGDSYSVERGGNNWSSQLAEGRHINFGLSQSVSGNGVSWLEYDYVQTILPREMAGGITSTFQSIINRVADGNVTLVYVDGVGNDFAVKYAAIYQGALAGTALTDFINTEIGYIRAELDALSAAGPVKFVMENVGDISDVPFIVQNFGNFLGLQPGEPVDPLKTQRFTEACRAANDAIYALADERHIPVVDQFGWAKRIFDTSHPLVVGGFELDVSPLHPISTASPVPPGSLPVSDVRVTDPLRLFVDSQHVTPIPQGLKANIVLDAIRQAYGVDVTPFSDQDILRYAYERAGQTPPPLTGATYFDVSGLVHYTRIATRVNVAGGSFLFDGQPHPATGSVVGEDGAGLGSPTFTYSYTDGAGQLVTTSNPPVEAGSYTVTATFTGDYSYAPASATATIVIAYDSQTLTNLNEPFHAGRVIPIKLQLLDANGNNISSPDIDLTAIRLVRSDGTEVALEDAGNSNPGDLFRYDAALGGYIFNLSTKDLAADSYTFYWAAEDDPTEHWLSFSLD